jgi:RNA polymerase sigma factor (sigma-70 family)
MFGYKKFSDEKLIELIQIGDQSALVALYKENYTMVRNFILRNSGDEDEVADVLQDSLIAVWQNVNKDTFHLTVKLSTYLMSIVKNQWFKRLKKKSRFVVVDESIKEKIAKTTELQSSTFDHEIIREKVKNLDETCMKLLSFFYFDGLNNKSIAQKLGFANTDTVKSKKYQCFKKLQKEVLKEYNKEDFFE